MFVTGRIRAAFFFASGGAGKGKRQGRARRENGQNLPGQGKRIVNQIESVKVIHFLVVVVLVFVQKITFDSCYVFLEKSFFCSRSS